jgi:Pyruvate/2-oxoacid:ferredoxin oxidoreductase delta subunit/flavodoxin
MKSFETSLLYFLSGTGNTYRVACWIKDCFDKNKIETRLKSIDEADFHEDFHDSNCQLTAVLFPTHGFMPPWSMIKFLFRMPRQKKVPVMIVATRGALRIGPVKIPGAAGFAHFFAALVLLFKGYDIRGFFSLDMAANMNNLHPSLTLKAVERISERTRQKISFFLARIISRKRVIFTLNNLYEGIWTTVLFWWIPIFPIIYLIYGKTTMAKMMFASNKCVSCGSCTTICSNHAIEMKNFMGKKRPFWTYHCENCMRCMGYCKQNAIEAGHSWAILQSFFVTIPVVAKLLSWLTISTGLSFEIKNYWLWLLVDTLYFLPALFLSYWLFWMLIRIPVVNSIFSVSTLTHYFKHYHEPETRLKHLVKKKKPIKSAI